MLTKLLHPLSVELLQVLTELILCVAQSDPCLIAETLCYVMWSVLSKTDTDPALCPSVLPH